MMYDSLLDLLTSYTDPKAAHDRGLVSMGVVEPFSQTHLPTLSLACHKRHTIESPAAAYT